VLSAPADSLNTIVAIVGATATGKSALALDLATQIGGEIINTDAMAVYRGMDIGTAKPTLAERRGIPHHLLDLLEVHQPLTVAEFQTLARRAIREVRSRQRTPILVGGSALYTRATLDNFNFPGTNPQLRGRLDAELATLGVAPLYDRLRQLDPDAAESIRPENGRRIVRALEVIELTGRPFKASLPEQRYHDSNTIQVGLDIDRPTLHARIAQRVDRMFQQGFVQEVEALIPLGLMTSRTAKSAIGYREVAASLIGEITTKEALERTIIATRKFARRQDSWFKKDSRVHWLSWNDSANAQLVQQIIGLG
jgi:tRNA dimethylallyltransferase